MSHLRLHGCFLRTDSLLFFFLRALLVPAITPRCVTWSMQLITCVLPTVWWLASMVLQLTHSESVGGSCRVGIWNYSHGENDCSTYSVLPIRHLLQTGVLETCSTLGLYYVGQNATCHRDTMPYSSMTRGKGSVINQITQGDYWGAAGGGGRRSRDGHIHDILAEMAASHFFASPSQVTSHFLASPSQVTSHFLASPSQVTSHLVRRQVKSSHKSFGPNTSQVTSLFVQVQVKSHIILSSCNTQSGTGIKSIYSELQSKI